MRGPTWTAGIVGALALGLAAPAAAQTVVVGAGGGYDLPTTQPWTGLDIAFHGDQLRGFSFVGRVKGGWGFVEQRPMGQLEAGFSGAIRAPFSLTRIGIVGHARLTPLPYEAPLQIGGTPDDGTYGNPVVLPGGVAFAELGWVRPNAEKGLAAWSIGFRAGAVARLGLLPCETQIVGDPEQVCLRAQADFDGGLTGRLRLHEGVYFDVIAGPSAWLSIGYAFPPKKWKAQAQELAAEREAAGEPGPRVVEERRVYRPPEDPPGQ